MINAVGNTMISAPSTPFTLATRSRHSLTWVTGSPESTMVSPRSTMNAISSSNDDPSIGDDHPAAAWADRAVVPAGAAVATAVRDGGIAVDGRFGIGSRPG